MAKRLYFRSMSKQEEYFSIGKFSAAFGLSGQLILQHALGKKNVLKGLEVLFIEEKKDSFLPFFIEEIATKTDTELYIKLEGINTKEAAQKLARKQVWLREADFRKHSAKQTAISLLGFLLINGKEEIGEIIEVIEQPHQMLCTVMLGEKEALIPLHEASLKNIDQKKRQVFVELPDGLLDLYK
jgi:16S rRNA processing protein RimM